jgi:hypothetical protein
VSHDASAIARRFAVFYDEVIAYAQEKVRREK